MTDTRTETEKLLYELAEKYDVARLGSTEESLLTCKIAQIIMQAFAPPEPRKVEGWVNVYPGQPDDEALCAYRSRRAADLGANATRIACVYVSGEEGKGPSE